MRGLTPDEAWVLEACGLEVRADDPMYGRASAAVAQLVKQGRVVIQFDFDRECRHVTATPAGLEALRIHRALAFAS